MYKICNQEKEITKIKNEVKLYTKKILKYKNNFLENTFNYINKFNTEYFPNMKITINEYKLENTIDILTELINYLTPLSIVNKQEILKILYRIKTVNTISYSDKKFIIQNIENKDFIIDFLYYIKSKYSIIPELELLYGKYSSILHLIIISKTIKHKYELSFKYNTDSIELTNNNKIFIYSAKKYVKLCTNNSIWIKQLIMRYCYFNFILKTTQTPKVLSFFLIDFPKILYNSGIIGPAEINTGITNGIYINITRKEEALKSLLHELIHFHNMDFREIPEYLNTFLYNKFSNTTTEGFNMKLNIFEAYTEFTASIINICMFYNYNTMISIKKNMKLYLQHFIERLYQQIIYTYSKCYKLINYFNCQLANKNILNKCNINQKTNAVSYFLIKSYMYNYINVFIKCLNVELLSFNTNSFNILYKIIKLGFNNNNLIELYKICNKLKNKKFLNNINNSMKMVCIIEP
jgi:hypothetical protein